MARHCPRDEYTTDDESEEACPVCGKPLLTDEEVRKGWGAYAGNPDQWYDRRVKVQKVYGVLVALLLGFAVLGLGLKLLNEMK